MTEIEFHPLRLVEETARFYGGTVMASPKDPRVTHVIVDESDRSRLGLLRSIRSKSNLEFHLVSGVWISESLANLKLLNESDYQV